MAPHFESVIGFDPNGIRRIYASTWIEARQEARNYIRNRPDTAPLSAWRFDLGPHKGTSTYTASRRGGVPLPPISGQPQQNSQSGPVEQPQATTPHEERARTDEVGLANLALGMKYRGDERTSELPLTQDMIRQLAFESQFRNMSIGGPRTIPALS